MELKNLNYNEIKERLLDAKNENQDLIESINLMDTPLIQDNYEKLVKLVFGDDVEVSKIDFNYLIGVLNELQIHLLIEVDDNFKEISEIATVIQEQLSKGIVYNNVDVLQDNSIVELVDSEDDFIDFVNDDEVEYENEEVEEIEDEEEFEDVYEDVEEVEELFEDLEINYKDLVNDIKLRFSSNYISAELEGIISKLKVNDNRLNDYDFKFIVSILLGNEINLDKVDSKDFANFVENVNKDFNNIKELIEAELSNNNQESINNEQNDENLDNNELQDELGFYTKCCGYLNDISEPLKKYEGNRLDSSRPRYNIKYNSSKLKKKIKIKGLEPKIFLESLKKYGKYAVVGAGVGLVGAALVPSAVISGVGTIRLVYATAKLGNKIISKGFLNGKPTVVDKVINLSKDKIKNFEINKKVKNLDTGEKEVVKVKFSDTRLYSGIKKVNDFLKKPETQWFINGMAVGYKIGDALNFGEKFRSILEANKNTTVTVPNETLTLETEATESIVTEPTVPQDNVIDIPKDPVDIPSTEIIDTPNVPTTEFTNTIDYSYLDTGDNIDLSGVEQGFTNCYSAMNNNGAVDLINKYAVAENGTFIKELRLSDGSVFTGNIGELLKTGINPSEIAARVANKNGDYAWLNLEDILESLAETSNKARVLK